MLFKIVIFLRLRNKSQLVDKNLLMVIGTFLENLKSSTPDGLAPLSQTAVAIFAITISAISLLWAGANLFLLLRQAALE